MANVNEYIGSLDDIVNYSRQLGKLVETMKKNTEVILGYKDKLEKMIELVSNVPIDSFVGVSELKEEKHILEGWYFIKYSGCQNLKVNSLGKFLNICDNLVIVQFFDIVSLLPIGCKILKLNDFVGDSDLFQDREEWQKEIEELKIVAN